LEGIHTNILFCINSLNNFVLNKLPSNISTSEDFGTTSRNRQKILTDIDICELLVELINVAFPYSGEEIPEDKKKLIENFQTEAFRTNMQAGNFAKMDKALKTEILF
jgi:hypothetical protein